MSRRTACSSLDRSWPRALPASVIVALLLSCVLASGCAKGVGRGGRGVAQPCTADLDCARGLTCTSGTCALPIGTAACTPGARSCDGSDVVQCNATGQGTKILEACANGCEGAACVDPVCEVGDRRCAADGIEQCSADAAGTQSWQLVQPCSAGCDAATVSCLALSCNPLSVRCSPADQTIVETCAADGASWLDQKCPAGNVCANGSCVAPVCNIGDERCGANGVEACTAVAGGQPAWQLVQACTLGCDAITNSCVQLVCKPLDVRCSPTLPNTVESCLTDGSGWSTADVCAAGTVCAQGVCTAQSCTPNAATCNGSSLTICDSQGSGTVSSSPCPRGCSNGACVQGSCVPGETQCQNGGIQVCASDGSGFTPTQTCGGNSCIVVAPGIAACGTPVCTPLARRCADGNSVEVCLADGSGWSSSTACDPGGSCAGGVCSAPPAACISGALRCAGSSVQECESGSWVTIGACFGGCIGGSCSGGSCGGAITVQIPLPACALTSCPPPADGSSSLLAIAGPLLDSNGATLPDGTLVTVAATGGASIMAADADSTTPGVQVRSVSGYADFAFRAPPSSAIDGSTNLAHVTISAQIGASTQCAGAASADFAPASGFAYVAEDFTSDARRDLTATTADWRTDLGIAESRSFPFGTGTDGPLDLSSLGSGGIWNLAQTPRGSGLPPFAPALPVINLGAQSAQVQGSVAGFAAGDEVMLIQLQSASTTTTTNAGAWELLNIASVSDGQLSFTTPILGSYGSATGKPIAGEKVAVQRIPQFTSVNVPAGRTLTASAWNGTLGGVVAFRANGAVTAAGSISADAIGYRAGTSTGPAINQPGESFGGQPAAASAASARNLGAGGGGYLLCDPAHQDQLNTWYGAGGSYGSAGFAGSSTAASTAAIQAGRAPCSAQQGLPYGSPLLSRIFLGSGSGTQQFNSQGPCSTATCPGESRGPGFATTPPAALDYGVAFFADLPDGGVPALPTGGSFTFCPAETSSYTYSYQTAGSSGCNTALNPNCAQTVAACGTQASQFGGTTQTLSHTSFNFAGDAPCTSPACNDTAAYCGRDTKTFTTAWKATGASNCDTNSNANCAQSYANCSSSFYHSFSGATCLTGVNCAATYPAFAANNCSQFTNSTLSAAQHRPCGSNQTCLNTFTTCGVTTDQATNTSSCVAACPGLGTNYNSTCSVCGCGNWNFRDCNGGDGAFNGHGCGAPSNCSYAYQSGVYSGHDPFSCSSCNSNEYCASSFGCGFLDVDACCDWNEYFCYDSTAIDNSCPGDGNGACFSCSRCQGSSGTGCQGNTSSGCDNYCQTSGGCTTNPGCTRNPGCSINPGCSTNGGCRTNTGCDTCGGEKSWDGTSCDFTASGNHCLCPSPWQDVTQGGRGGGILFLSAASLDLSGGGTVTARGGSPGVTGKPGFAGGAGGSLWVRTGTLKLAPGNAVQLDASGAINAGAGRVRFERASGDDAVALGRVLPLPYAPAFSVPQVQSVSLLSSGNAVAASLVPISSDPSLVSLIEGPAGLVTTSISADGAHTFAAITPGGAAASFAATSDLRFRIVFAARPGPIARAAALLFLVQLQ